MLALGICWRRALLSLYREILDPAQLPIVGVGSFDRSQSLGCTMDALGWTKGELKKLEIVLQVPWRGQEETKKFHMLRLCINIIYHIIYLYKNQTYLIVT